MFFYVVISIIAVAIILLTFKKPFWSLLTLLFLLPFHALIVNYLRFSFDLDWTGRLIISLWKEWFVLWLLIIGIIKIVKTRKCTISMYFFDWAIIILFILSLITIIWGQKNLLTIIFGLRFNFEMFALYFAVRLMDLDKELIKKTLYAIIGAASIVIAFGILQSTILPWDFLNNLGYTYAYEWLPGNNMQSSQIIEGSRAMSRILSTLSGPNQLGSYLAVIGSILLAAILLVKNNLKRILTIVLFLAMLIPFYRSYSRSAWIGLSIALIALLVFIVCLAFKKKKKPSKTPLLYRAIIVFAIIALLIAGLAVTGSVNLSTLQQAIERPSSTTGHFQAYTEALKIIKENPFGSGIGVAGPASQWSLGISKAIITESSYLQVGVETGLLGMIAFITVIVGLIWKSFQSAVKSTDNIHRIVALGSALGLISLAVSSLFLHSFTDSATAFTLFALIGIIISDKNKVDSITSKAP